MMKIANSLLVLAGAILLQSILAEGNEAKIDGKYHPLCPLDDDPYNPTHLQYEGNCRRFIKCSYGKSYVLACPLGLYWSQQHSRCEAKAVANCDENYVSPGPSIGGNGCSYRVKPQPNSCTGGLMCVNGNDSPIECPTGFYWDRDGNKCMYGGCPY